MKATAQPYRIIISGGGTGGHIYPAIAIANAIREQHPDAEILFVGAEGKMEMQKVPEAGYEIEGLWIAGIQRRLTLDNLAFPFKLISSMWKARAIVKRFKPDVAVGVGGYASGPLLKVAASAGVPCLLQEQNSYAGLTNKILAEKASKICVAHEGMDKFFPKKKIVITGNPVRSNIGKAVEVAVAKKHFGLKEGKPTLLIIGGSGGARTFNETLLKEVSRLVEKNIQVIWQTGKFYYEDVMQRAPKNIGEHVKIHEFLKEMDMAYAASDVVISRAGALSIAELAIVGKPVIFVPSPNVAEDHQTKNAKSLVERRAALMISDANAQDNLITRAISLLNDVSQKAILSQNIAAMAKPDAAKDIAREVINLIKS